jgi:chromosome segregation ATPase
MSDKDYRRLDPIVPQRDEANAQRTGGKKTPPPPRGNADKRSGGGGFWKLMTVLLLAGLVALGFYTRHQSRALADLDARFTELADRIESTDESLSESGAALRMKIKDHDEALEKHWSEIKKLWGVSYDTNRKAIAANTEAVESQAEAVKNIRQTVEAVQKKVDQTARGMENLRGSTLAAGAAVEEVRERTAGLSGDIKDLESTIGKMQRTLQGRVAKNEEAIEAIDAYRLQVNEQLAQIRRQLGGGS